MIITCDHVLWAWIRLGFSTKLRFYWSGLNSIGSEVRLAIRMLQRRTLRYQLNGTSKVWIVGRLTNQSIANVYGMRFLKIYAYIFKGVTLAHAVKFVRGHIRLVLITLILD